MILPLPSSAILGLPLCAFLTPLPELSELVAGLGKRRHRTVRLASADDRRDFRRRKPFHISEHQDRAIRDRRRCQDVLYFLGQFGLDSRVRIRKFKGKPAITMMPINRCRG